MKPQRFTDEFDEWNDVTGALEKGTGWYWEARSIVVDADAELEKLRGLLRRARHAADMGFHGGSTSKSDCVDCILANEIVSALPADRPTPLIKNGYCTDCGGINLHYDHCVTVKSAAPR